MFVIPSSAGASLPPINFIHQGLERGRGEGWIRYTRKSSFASTSSGILLEFSSSVRSFNHQRFILVVLRTRSREVTVPDVEGMKKTRQPLKYHMGAGMEFKVSFLNSRRDSFENHVHIHTARLRNNSRIATRIKHTSIEININSLELPDLS